MSSAHLPLPSTPPPTPNAGFFHWVRSKTALYISQVAGVISVILYIATFVYYVIGHDPSHQAKYEEYLLKALQLIFILNVCFAFIFVTASLYAIHKEGEGTWQVRRFYKIVFGEEIKEEVIREGKRHLAQFKRIFFIYWAYVLLYYIGMSTFPSNGSHYFKWMAGNIMVFILYIAFCKIIQANENQALKSPIPNPGQNVIIVFLRTPTAGVVIYALLALVPFCDRYINRVHKVSPADWIQLLDLGSGIIKMILLSLIFSRFDSKLIGLSSSLIGVLYIYAIIQPLDVALGGTDIISKSMATMDYAIAFVIKLYYFLIISYAIYTGRMLNFFCCNGEMTRRLNLSRSFT